MRSMGIVIAQKYSAVWIGSWTAKYLLDAELFLQTKNDFEEQLANYLCDLPENKGFSDSEFDKLLKEEMAKYEPYWKRVIAIHADN